MKHQILSKFINDHSHLAEQGSKKWLEERQYTIGGSEIATVIGKNKYSTVQNLVAQKIGISQFMGNTATRWGSLFEGMTELIFQTLFLNGGAVHSVGSVQNKEIAAHKYSPDGLCIMKILNEIMIILLEFKAPLNSIPEGKVPAHYLPQVKAGLCTLDISQKAIFMNNMFRKCKLSNLNFTPSYDSFFHRDSKKKICFTQAIACGVILFSIPGKSINDFLTLYLREQEELEDMSDFEDPEAHEFALSENEMSAKEESDASDGSDGSDHSGDSNCSQSYANPPRTLLQKIYKNVAQFLKSESDHAKYSMLDIGNLCREDTEEWLKLYKPNDGACFLQAKYIKPNLNVAAIVEGDCLHVSSELNFLKTKKYVESISRKFNFKKTIEKYKLNSLKKGNIPVAVLPWKLMKSDILVVDKDPDFLDLHKEKINKVAENIKYIIDNANNLDDRVEIFDKLYPGTKIANDYWDSKITASFDAEDFI